VRIERILSFLRSLGRPSLGGRDGAHPETRTEPPKREDESSSDTVRLGPTDTLDLHTFLPRDVQSVVGEFLDAAVREGFERVRIIHGKGIGVQRGIVRSVLERHPDVVSFADAPDGSGWGATIAILRSSSNPAGRG
jgi:dsDNA-specific endonuclease/ATPase MutS2